MNIRLFFILLTIVSSVSLASARNTNDNPLPPTNAKATLAPDNTTVIVSWDPVDVIGESGGIIDPTEVTYYIFDAFASYFDPAIAVTTSTSFTFDYSDIVGQDFVAYQITAGVDEFYYSLATSTNMVSVGAPYIAPWMDSFAGKQNQYPWAWDTNSSFNVTTKLCSDTEGPGSADGDGGYLMVTPKKKGDFFGLISGKIDISDLENPAVSLDYIASANTLGISVATDDADSFSKIMEVDMKQNPAATWSTVSADLALWKDASWIQLEIVLDACDNNSRLLLDRIVVADDPSAGVDKFSDDSGNFIVSSTDGGLHIVSSTPCEVNIVSTSGILVYGGAVTDATLLLSPGVYIIKTPTKAMKCLVR